MWEADGIYAPGPIQPVAKIKENLAIWTLNKWGYYKAEYIEPIPRSTPFIAEMVTLSGATTLAAGGTIVRRVLAVLQLNERELLHLRWEPLDYVEGLLWEQAGQARYNTRGGQARVDPSTKTYDPFLATTTFWVLGRDRDMNLEARNPQGVAIPTARFAFWGYRYVLSNLVAPAGTNAKLLEDGDLDVVKKAFGAVTWIPAEGRAA